MIVYSTVLRSRRVTLPMRRCALRAIVRLRGTECIAVSILLPRTALAIARLVRGYWWFSPVGAGSGRVSKITSQSRKDRKGYAKERKKSFAESMRSWLRGETNYVLHLPAPASGLRWQKDANFVCSAERSHYISRNGSYWQQHRSQSVTWYDYIICRNGGCWQLKYGIRVVNKE